MDLVATMAEAVLRGDEAALNKLLSAPLVVARNNFVERPWGGTLIREHKGLHPLPEQALVTGLGIGEAFELAAFDADEEAARFPSRVVLEDRSWLALPRLLEAHGERILGEAFVARYGARLPLLPKTLDVKELLSVQGHPPGHTEVYIILDAEPGATLAVGFSTDMDRALLERRLTAGLESQRQLQALLDDAADLHALQRLLAPWFAAPDEGVDVIRAALGGFFAAGQRWQSAATLLDELKDVYWAVLGSLNAIEAVPGQVIYNATPGRLLAPGQLPSAEVHALGNPARREVLALEIRLPGPTYRAWDNVRFPQRPVDVAAALAALNLKATSPADFIREEVPDPERPGVSCSVDSEFFRVEHFRPVGDVRCELTGPACLHVVAGATVVRDAAGEVLARLTRGDAALVPAGLEDVWLASEREAHVISVTLPHD